MKNYPVTVSFVNFGALKARLYVEHRRVFVRTLHVYVTTWMEFGTRGLRVMILSMRGFVKSVQVKPCAPYGRKKFTFTLLPCNLMPL
jgi:hypothetical protein